MNWGYKVMIGFSAFALMMIYLVFRAYKTDFQLVEKEYYKSELQYQQVIDGKHRINQLKALPEIYQVYDTVSIQLPPDLKGVKAEGTIWFYCPYEAKNDHRTELQIDESGKQSIVRKFQPGTYLVRLHFKVNGEYYYFEKLLDIS